MKELIETKQKIVTHLDKVSQSKSLESVGEDAYQKLIEFMKAGKCIRGSLAYLSYKLLGGTDEKKALDLACALEFFQAMILILDDIIDEDESRRGLPTMHTALGKGKRGSDLALCLAPLATFEGFGLLKDMPPLLIQKVSELMKETSYGEMIDITLNELDKEKSLQLYISKTGKYTFSLPLLCGAILAGREELVETLESYGTHTGILFQVRDDMLELVSTDADIGKSVASDIRNNIYSYPRYALAQKLSAEEQKELNSIYGTNPSAEQLKYIRELYQKYDIQKDIEELAQEENTSIAKLVETIPQHLRQLLLELTSYCMTRTK